MSEENKTLENSETSERPDLQVKDSWFWFSDTRGNGSVTVTFATIAFLVTTVSYILSMFESLGPVTMRPFDTAAATSYMGIAFTLYMGKSFTDAKYNQTK